MQPTRPAAVRTEPVAARLGGIVLSAVAPVTLLAVDPWGWYPFGPVKVLAVSVLATVGAALVIGSTAPRLPRGLGLALFALVALIAAAAWFGEDGIYAWVGTPERRFGALTWVLSAVMLISGSALAALPRAGTRLATGVVVAGLGVGGFATAEAVGWEPSVFDVATRLTATMGSAAYLGAAAALLLPTAVGVALDSALRPILRRAAGLAAALLAVALVGSGARAAWAGLAVAVLVVAVARRRWLVDNAPRAVPGAALAAVALVMVAGLTPAGERLAELTDPDANGGRGRLDEWRVAAKVIGEHPVLGVGPEGYRIAFREGVDIEYEREHGRDEQPDRAHSGPLDVAVTGGFPALLAWGAVMAFVAQAVWRTASVGSWHAGLAAGLVAHWAGQLFFFPVVEIEPWAWLLAGFLVGRSQTAAPPRLPHPTAALGLAAVAVVAAVLGATDVVADHRARAADDALGAGDVRTAAREAEAAVDLRPDIVRLHLLAAAAKVADGQGTLSGIRQIEDALDVSPGDPVLLRAHLVSLVDRAVATLVPAHEEEASRALDRLLAEDPHNARYWQQAERLAQVRGDKVSELRARNTWLSLVPPERRR